MSLSSRAILFTFHKELSIIEYNGNTKMTIIKLTNKDGNAVYLNADHIRTFIESDAEVAGTELLVIQERYDPFFFKETPEEIAKLIEKADPLHGIWESLYKMEYYLSKGALS